MKYNEIVDEDEIYLKLKNEINTAEGKSILLKRLISVIESLSHDMPAYLQSPEGQAVFYNAVMKLVSEKLISSVGNKPNTYNGLHLKYKINSVSKEKDKELATQIVRGIELPATLDYYIKHPDDYLDDENIIKTISDFLKQGNNELVTVNERAYELFGDEKFFKGDERIRSRGEVVLKRLGLGYSSIGCEETVEPFFCFSKKDFSSSNSRNIYIVENKDTFWSLKKNAMDFSSTLKLDMLIYGEGKKILSSFKFVDEYDIEPENDVFFYFGDLDAEGVNIYCELKDRYPRYKIYPFYEGYQAVLDIGLKREFIKTPKNQKLDEKNIEVFTKTFDNAWAVKIKKLLKEGYYIPQEALSATRIKKRFGKIAHD